MLNCLAVGIGGFIGAVCRYLMGFLPVQSKTGFPWITLIINCIGAFAIGLIAASAARYGWGSSRVVLLLKTGVCGGFTTFSTFALESSVLMGDGKTGTAFAYMVSSVVLCVLAVILAQRLVLS